MASFFAENKFDASKVAPSTGFSPFPPGDYLAIVKDAKETLTKDKTGLMMEVYYRIVGEGPGKGRQLTQRIILKNKNPQCVEIGMGELSSLCNATGVILPKDAVEFQGKTCTIRVDIEKRADNGELTNRVKGVVVPDARAPAAAAPAPGAIAPAPAAPPWG